MALVLVLVYANEKRIWKFREAMNICVRMYCTCARKSNGRMQVFLVGRIERIMDGVGDTVYDGIGPRLRCTTRGPCSGRCNLQKFQIRLTKTEIYR